jgi:hypothetical protein
MIENYFFTNIFDYQEYYSNKKINDIINIIKFDYFYDIINLFNELKININKKEIKHCLNFLEFTNLNKGENFSEKILPFILSTKIYNNILNMDLHFKENNYYEKRLNKISFFFNPHLEIFNDIFSLNDNNNESYIYKDIAQYK